MEGNSVIVDDVLKAFEGKYVFEIDETYTDELVIRANVTSAEEAEMLFKSIALYTHTQWLVYRSLKTPRRVVYTKIKICHASKLRKTKFSKKNANCRAKFRITIKKMTKDAKAHDRFLKLDPPLCAKITLTKQHSHPVHSVDFLGMLTFTPEVKEMFFSYFDDGMGIKEAISFHQRKLLSERDPKMLANTAFNPSYNQAKYLHQAWKTKNVGKQRLRKWEKKIYVCQKKALGASSVIKDRFDMKPPVCSACDVFIKCDSDIQKNRSVCDISQDMSDDNISNTNVNNVDESSVCDIFQDMSEDDTSDTNVNNEDTGEHEDAISTSSESESIREENISSNENSDESGAKKIKYFVFESNNLNSQNKKCSVTDEEALSCAETLFCYIKEQNNVNDMDRTLMQSFIWKIKEKMFRKGGII